VDKEKWVELSLTVDGELAEAVADVLSRYISSGVVIENNIEYEKDHITIAPVSQTRVFGYIPVDINLNETKKLIEEGIWHLSQIVHIPSPMYKPIEDENWMEAWKENYHPISVGNKMLILPAWVDQDAKERIPVRINPGMAFGTGAHPTTQLCMEALEEFIIEGESIIDVGCGSGILSIAAVLLGAKNVLAVDIEPESIELTTQNGLLNDVKDKIEVGLGSVKEVLSGIFNLQQAPVIMVNILAPIIHKLFEDGLVDLVETDGYLLLSGILVSQKNDILASATFNNLSHVKTIRKGDWLGMTFKKLT